MDNESGYWNRSAGTAFLCAIADLPDWINDNSTDSEEQGPHIAGLFLTDPDTANETTKGEYVGRLLPAIYAQAAQHATHLAFRTVANQPAEIELELMRLRNIRQQKPSS